MSSSTWIRIAALWWLSAACSREGAPKATSPAPNDAAVTVPGSPPEAPTDMLPVATGKKCIVLLHGKGGAARNRNVTNGTTYLQPGGNADGWGGRQWLYYPEDRYQQVRASLASAIGSADCGHAIVQGFSNGGAAAAKLFCRGERFDGRVIGYIIDDPVPDHAVESCTPAAGVRVRLYWTGGLAVATDGWSCATQDWTCEGGRTIGIEKYAQALGTEVKKSIHTTHAEYSSAPEQTVWFDQAG